MRVKKNQCEWTRNKNEQKIKKELPSGIRSNEEKKKKDDEKIKDQSKEKKRLDKKKASKRKRGNW